MTEPEPAVEKHAQHDLVAWHRSLTPQERLYVAFELSELAAELGRQGANLAGK